MVDTKLRHLMTGIILVSVILLGFLGFGTGLLGQYGQTLGNETRYFTGATNATKDTETTIQDMEAGTEGEKLVIDQEERLDIFGTLWDTMRLPFDVIKNAWFLVSDVVDLFGLPTWSRPIIFLIPLIFTLILIGAAWRTTGI